MLMREGICAGRGRLEVRTNFGYSIKKRTMKASMRHKHYNLPGCSVEAALEAIGGKWKGGILFHLLDGTKRFSELRRLLPGITQRALTQQLRELEFDGVVHRKVYAQVPPRVDYSLTVLGQSLKPVVKLLEQWGDRYQSEKQDKIRKAAKSTKVVSSSR